MRPAIGARATMLALVLLSSGQLGLAPFAFAEESALHAGTQATTSIELGVQLQNLPAQARSSTLVKQIKRTISFAPASAELTAEAEQILAAAARLVPPSATEVTVRSDGYVQRDAFHGNDISLSTRRARVVASELRRLGVEGAYSVSGRGRAVEPGGGARRAEVVISFTVSG